MIPRADFSMEQVGAVMRRRLEREGTDEFDR